MRGVAGHTVIRKVLLAAVALAALASCHLTDHSLPDRLNDAAYYWHYRNIDSTEHYARRALDVSTDYADGRAEALNHLAFTSLVRMDYDRARLLLDSVPLATDNQLELLVSYVQQMRLCQRRSANREFYDFREQALQCLHRIGEERPQLDDRQKARLLYAETEMAIVTSTYYYYVGLERQSSETMLAVASLVERDTAQLMNYLYNVGAGGIITKGTQAEIYQQEFDCLMRCFLMAQHTGCGFFAANALEGIAEHFINPDYRRQLMADNLPAMKFINPDGVPDDQLPLWLAGRSLDIFRDYGDVYQTAGAYRTLASCHLAQDDYEKALDCLEMSLSDSTILQAPDLVASIREQLSVAYSAIDNKAESDYNRNSYLDLQYQKRQDPQIESPAGQMEQSLKQTERLLWAVVAALGILVMVLLFYYLRHKRNPGKSDSLLQEMEEELKEQTAMMRLNVEKGERRNVEQRAKVSIVMGIMPLIDRIIHAIDHLEGRSNSGQPSVFNLQYISELTGEINRQNDLLTHWVKLRQGELSLHIETFPLREIFDMVSHSERTFTMRGIRLCVKPTPAMVKADRVLTLFMLNTLADNARKFTPDGGTVAIEATEKDDCVEVSVSDTGCGMDDAQLANLFTLHTSTPTPHPSPFTPEQGHGFGLLNCKGIIDKYRKTSPVFSVCRLWAESRMGEGSRFIFSLPKGAVGKKAATASIALLCLLAPFGPMTSAAPPSRQAANPYLSQASIYADSAFFSNINGTYERTLLFADSCRQCLNRHYLSLRPNSTDTMLCMGDLSTTPPEIAWLHDSLDTNYNMVLDIRNECAVAALALHRWQLYQYNNRIYTQLFKELSADSSLDSYCRKMQQMQTNRQVAIVMLVVLFLGILLAVAWQFMQAMKLSVRRREQQQDRLDILRDELQRLTLENNALHVSNSVLDNTLSTLKHETMYYPSRILQIVVSHPSPSTSHPSAPTSSMLREVVAYYRELYGLLSAQAMSQTAVARLHVRPLNNGVLGDENLIRLLFDILKKENGQQQPETTYMVGNASEHGKYVECHVNMASLQRTDLFTPSREENIPWLICRQIVRDHGEATNRRACAIRAEKHPDGQGVSIVITLPGARSS